jgi:HAE1 family hydrophobic/amphiphilic exporter-1
MTPPESPPIRRIPGSLFLAAVVAVASALQAPLTLFAQEALRTVTLDQALATAMEKNRDIQKAEEYRAWVRGKYVEERAAALPQIRISAYHRRDYDDTLSKLTGGLFPPTQDTTDYQAGLDQALYTWGQVGAAIRAAKVGLATAEEQWRLYRQAVRRDVTAAFHDVLLARELEEIARQALDQKTRHLEEARKKYALGTATDYDVLAADVAVQNARPEFIRAQSRVTQSRLSLAFLLGIEDGEVDAAGSLSAAPELTPAYEQVLASAKRYRPEVIAQGQAVAIRRELVKIARAGDKPRLDFSAAYGRKTLGVSGLSLDGKTWNAGVFLSFPVFDGLKTRGRLLQARSDQTTAEIEERRLLEALSVEARRALDAVREAEEVLEALQGSTLQAERLLAMAEKGYEYGVKTKLEVDDAQLSLSTARGDFARASRDLLVARTNLRWVMGTLGEPEADGPAAL